MDTKEHKETSAAELQLYRIPEVAKKLGISVSAVRREIQSGRLKAYKIGRSIAVPLSGLRSFLRDLEA
jgi:excisionase family DNA binding protein